jgi:hypothetical protein
MWNVEYTREFEAWWNGLERGQQAAISVRVDLLAASGPNLRRPVVGTIAGSELANLKELRCASDGSLRVLFAFDPRRTAILLLGENKAGRWRQWYKEAIPAAERIYRTYLAELREEGSCDDRTQTVQRTAR